jgi:hypothetical protein
MKVARHKYLKDYSVTGAVITISLVQLVELEFHLR